MKDTRPSATAKIVARGILLTSNHPSFTDLVPADMASITEAFLRACPRSAGWDAGMMRRAWYRHILYLIERMTIPGIALHFALRKRCIEEQTRQALAEGITQVVIIGAGFDTLAVRLAREFADVRFIEIDHPATQQVKLNGMNGNGNHEALPNLSFHAVDLTRRRLEESLQSFPDYDSSGKTLFIAEGLTMYLTAEEVATMVQTIRRNSPDGSRLLFTFMECNRHDRIRFSNETRLVAFWLSLKKEQFQWGIDRAELRAWLGERDFLLRDITDTESLMQRYIPEHAPAGMKPAQGEMICIAESLTR